MKTLPVTMFLLLAMPVGAQTQTTSTDDWDNLRYLKSEQKIEVVKITLEKVKGKFLTYSENAISLEEDGQGVTIFREDVFRVTDIETTRRGRSAMIGMAIGAAIGLGYGAAHSFAVGLGDDWSSRPKIGALAGGLLGLGLGSLHPGHPTVFRLKDSPTVSEKPTSHNWPLSKHPDEQTVQTKKSLPKTLDLSLPATPSTPKFDHLEEHGEN